MSSALEAIADISEPVRETLIEAVERRFGSVDAVPAGYVLEFLSDNGAAYIAADTRALARSMGLKPINTPVCSPQSNGMAESFVNTFKRDYVARMDLRDAQTVLGQLPAAFEHFNERHPHSSLKMRSPREFRRQQAARAPGTSDGPGALLRLGRGREYRGNVKDRPRRREYSEQFKAEVLPLCVQPGASVGGVAACTRTWCIDGYASNERRKHRRGLHLCLCRCKLPRVFPHWSRSPPGLLHLLTSLSCLRFIYKLSAANCWCACNVRCHSAQHSFASC